MQLNYKVYDHQQDEIKGRGCRKDRRKEEKYTKEWGKGREEGCEMDLDRNGQCYQNVHYTYCY